MENSFTRKHNAPFYWKSGYMGGNDFIIRATGQRIELHRELSDYHRSVLNADWVEARESIVNCITLCAAPMTAKMVADFNAWRIGEHEANIADMKSQPERFGSAESIDEAFPTPAPVRGATWTDGAFTFTS